MTTWLASDVHESKIRLHSVGAMAGSGYEAPVERTYRFTTKGIPYKNGCELHADCYSCPYPDCVATTAQIKKVAKV